MRHNKTLSKERRQGGQDSNNEITRALNISHIEIKTSNNALSMSLTVQEDSSDDSTKRYNLVLVSGNPRDIEVISSQTSLCTGTG